MKKVVFISHFMPLNMNATSTDITTDSLIKGLQSNDIKLFLILFVDNVDEECASCIYNSYSSLSDEILVLKSTVGEFKGKLDYLFKISKNFFFYHDESLNRIDSIIDFCDDNTILFSHSPTFDSIFFCNYLKKHIRYKKWIQYWSDPLTIGGINPDNIPLQRRYYKFIEGKCLSMCDDIIYGPKTLCDFQKKVFSKYEYKMRGVDLFYIDHSDKDCLNEVLDNTHFLYAGNFFSYNRNVMPLFDAFNDNKLGFHLDVYGNGDQVPNCSDNICLHGRISPEKLKEVESKYVNIICVLNSNGIQIPGKVFYDMDRNVNILIIVDGKYGEDLSEYLKSYDRYVLVFNNKDDILNGLCSMQNYRFDTKKINNNYSPSKIVSEILK